MTPWPTKRTGAVTELSFLTELEWQGQPADGEGVCSLGAVDLGYSAPSQMGGLGRGANPESLLLAAVGSCYSITLARILKTADLPFSHVRVAAEGRVIGFPTETQFDRIIVHPEIAGAGADRVKDYARAAQRARDRCFIGGVVRGSLDYRVGNLRLVGP